MQKKISRSVIIASIVTAVALPASVYASTQPINSKIVGQGTLPVTKQKQGASLTGEEALRRIPSAISTTKDIFHSIGTGNIEGAINRILGILDQLGLVDPAYESARVGTDAVNPGDLIGDNPYSNPRTPEEVYELQRHLDTVRSEIPQKISQIVFGPQGRQTLLQQSQVVQAAQRTSLSGQQGVTDAYQESTKIAQQNVSHAENIAVQADNAKRSNVSQDVSKAIAAQNEDLAKIASGTSDQMAYLVKGLADQSAQFSAANAQLGVLNDRAQAIEVLGASQNYQMAQINDAINQQNHQQQLKDNLQQNAAYQASNLIYIPGLIPKGDRQ